MSDLPFLKNKDRKNLGGGTEVRDPDQSNDEQLLEHIGSELMDAIHRKDIGIIRQALEAIVQTIKGQD